MDEPLDQPERPLAERELGTPRRPEEVGDERKARPFDVGEEQRRATCGDDPAMNFGDFEICVDSRRDFDEIVVAAQTIEKRAEIGKHARLRAGFRAAPATVSSKLPP